MIIPLRKGRLWGIIQPTEKIVSDSHNQYRCTIIRGKAKNLLDDLLPAYASIINEITPIDAASFHVTFNKKLATYLPNADEKTLDNHRTEIAWKLFGMIYEDKNGNIYPSERTQKYLEDGDQPSFFKDMCYKFQFPNAADKLPKIKVNIQHNVSIRPYCLVINVLNIARTALTKNEIAYFILNNLDALSGKASSVEIVDAIFDARKAQKLYKVEIPSKETSYSMQHITEQLNYLELANLVRSGDGLISLNDAETTAIEVFTKAVLNLDFDIYSYDIEDPSSRKALYFDWQLYYSELSDEARSGKFNTSLEALNVASSELDQELMTPPAPMSQLTDTTLLGDDGERLIYNYEISRVAQYSKRLTNKVLLLGKTKGLGYDIQSIFGHERNDGEFVKYIEVKSTKRVTPPNFENEEWLDTLIITRNEWIAATQHKDSYEIYRVYFTSFGPIVAIIKNPFEKNEKSLLKVLPTHYRLDFGGTSVDSIINNEMLLTT